MEKIYKKKDFPVSEIRRLLEPGPIVLVSSQLNDKTNIMTMGWHTVMEFSPSLIGCIISDKNHSYEMIRKSKCCVINIPTVAMLDTIIGIGNTSGEHLNKFKKFKLTAEAAQEVKAPLIKECYANLECKIHDTKLLRNYNFFIFEIVKAHVATSPAFPKTVHYHGKGIFMISGKKVDHSKKFKPQNL